MKYALESDAVAASTPGHRVAVWLDCDPGHDDAFAIILAAHSPRLQLLGLSTAAGNSAVEKVTRNALDILHAAGVRGVDVVQGQSKPLLRPGKVHAAEYHGDSGIDGPVGGAALPNCGAAPVPGKAPVVMGERIAEFVRQHPERAPVRLVCTGALTNVALMLALHPELHRHLEIVMMGGAMGAGNSSPAAEFNMMLDPEAARMVFEAGVPLTMVPLEVTHTALVTPAVLASMVSGGGAAAAPSRFMASAAQMLVFFAGRYREMEGFRDPPLHDPCAVAYVIAPELFKTELMRVDIETCSPLSFGQTVCDVWHQTGRPKNCTVATSMDVGAFWELMGAAMRAADAVSPLNLEIEVNASQCAPRCFTRADHGPAHVAAS